MKTRTANHKMARCETCPYFEKNVYISLLFGDGLCNLHEHLKNPPRVTLDSYCGHHPDNEPLRTIA